MLIVLSLRKPNQVSREGEKEQKRGPTMRGIKKGKG